MIKAIGKNLLPLSMIKEWTRCQELMEEKTMNYEK